LKISTREVLYEKYRTDKLLARRATANISEKERKRLLQGEGRSVLVSRHPLTLVRQSSVSDETPYRQVVLYMLSSYLSRTAQRCPSFPLTKAGPLLPVCLVSPYGLRLAGPHCTFL
jgi:hypothetical protein